VIEQLEVRLGTQGLYLVQPCTLHAGRLYLLWGPSGSGKSTFARAVLGLGELASPRIPVNAAMVLTDADNQPHVLWNGRQYDAAAREHIAFFPQAGKLGFLDNLSAIDNLRLFSQLPREEARRQAESLAERFHLSAIPSRVAEASGGERIRLSAIRGLMPRSVGAGPPALILAD
jgi:ABC-type multidrug transport system ATPase subunit